MALSEHRLKYMLEKESKVNELKDVAVLGAGSWGTALAIVLADNGKNVKLWTHRGEQAEEINDTRENKAYLEGRLPEKLIATADLKDAITSKTEAIVLVVPTKAIREVCQQINKIDINKKVTIIHASKGIEPNTFKRVSEMISEELKGYREEDIVVLSGPSHAEEVAKRQPTTVTVSSYNTTNAKFAQDLFINDVFRVYTSTDVVGIEFGGALKNIIALGAGISDGLGYGDNAKAALITRGLAEMTRLGVALGANPLTFLGLPGVGDLIVTCTSVHSRNWRAGNMLGKGDCLDTILEKMGMVVEGVRTCEAVYALSRQLGVEMPITEGIYDCLYTKSSPKEIVKSLMRRDPRQELDEFNSFIK